MKFLSLAIGFLVLSTFPCAAFSASVDPLFTDWAGRTPFSAPMFQDPFFDAYPQKSTLDLPSGQVINTSFYFYGARVLSLQGLSDLDALNRVLAPYGKTAYTQDGHHGLIAINAADYEGSSAGPIKPIYLGALVNDRTLCQVGQCAPGLFFLTYYTNTGLAKVAGMELWALPKVLAYTELSLLDQKKGARVRAKNRDALSIVWGGSNVAPEPFQQTLAAITANTTNMMSWAGTTVQAAFNPATDSVHYDPNSAVGRILGQVGFTPFQWVYYPNARGVYLNHVWLK